MKWSLKSLDVLNEDRREVESFRGKDEEEFTAQQKNAQANSKQ